MDYSFWQRLTGTTRILRGEITPRCDFCRARTVVDSAPRLFLLPVYQDKDYTPSADYYARVCVPIPDARMIPVGRRACRMWQLLCPRCKAEAVSVVDFLMVRGQEVLEKLVVCDYPPLAGLLREDLADPNPADPAAQSFGYVEDPGNRRCRY